VKNCNKGKSGRKKIFGSLAGRKRRCIFLVKDVTKNIWEKAMKKRRARRINCKIKCQ
jgi:hypothetical protein